MPWRFSWNSESRTRPCWVFLRSRAGTGSGQEIVPANWNAPGQTEPGAPRPERDQPVRSLAHFTTTVATANAASARMTNSRSPFVGEQVDLLDRRPAMRGRSEKIRLSTYPPKSFSALPPSRVFRYVMARTSSHQGASQSRSTPIPRPPRWRARREIPTCRCRGVADSPGTAASDYKSRNRTSFTAPTGWGHGGSSRRRSSLW